MLPTNPAAALRLHQIDCSTRMFLVSLCLSDSDLAGFGFLASDRPSGASRKTAARAALHRILAAEPSLSGRVADLLDLRHLEHVSAVRAEEAQQSAARLERSLDALGGEDLAGWAWALLTDGRREVFLLGRRLMSECFVRGMQLLASTQARDCVRSVEGAP